MNKYFMILGVILMASFSFAHITPSNPYMNAKFANAFCQYNNIFAQMQGAVATYNASYSSAMNTINGSLSASLGHLNGYYCSDYSIVSFNQEYSGTFNPLIAQGSAIYFRAGFDAIQSHSTTWGALFSQYNTFIGDNFHSCFAHYANMTPCGA